jgi:hypothetical protein
MTVVLLLTAPVVVSAAEPTQATEAAPEKAETPSADAPAVKAALDEACALLDDPEKLALMDGLLLKLAIECDRTDLLGRVRQEPRMEVGAPDTGTDTPVNDPSGDTGSSTTQSETSLAVNEATGTICSGFNDSYHGVVTGQGYTGFARSTDGGATFTDGGGLDPGTYGDPAMVWRKSDGYFYLATLGSTGLRIYRSIDDCQSLQLLGNIHNDGADDKELMAVDNNPASPYYGHLYVVWTNFGLDYRIWATTSTDGGTTWGATQGISSSSNVQGAWPAVAPDGTVYAGWTEFGSGITIRVSKSTDGGTTWSAVTAPATNKVQPQDSVASGNCGRPSLRGNIRYLASPQVAVGPDNAVHVVYSYDPDGFNTGDTVDVFYRRSTDQGATWQTELLVNDDGTTRDQFFPTLSVGATNAVSVAWYDRRNDAANTMVDYYQRTSFDGGDTWGPSVRVSDVSTPIYLDPNLATCYHGDYDTQVQTETEALIQWSDDRRIYNAHNDPDVYLDTVPVCLLSILAPAASAGVGGPNLIQVGWDDSATPEISEYRVYRSFFAGGPYQLIVTVPDSSPGVPGGVGYTYSDYDVSGGTEYFYVVRSSDGGACLSDPSNEVSAVATGDCTLPPLFGGVETVVNPATSLCSLELGWSTGASRCGGDVAYNVYRSTTPGFIPAPQNLIATGLTGTAYVDGGPLQSQVRHYYVVRAVDSVNGAEEENIEEGSAVPTGPFSIGTWTDDAGDTGDATLTPESPWSVAAAGGNLGPHVYLTGTYGNNVCASVTTPSMMVGTGSTLSFWSKYQIENSWDKGVVEISSDGGSTWAKVPVNYPGNSSNTSDACGLPTGTYFTGSTTGLTWTEYTASLAAWDGLDVMLRWRLSTDGSVTYQGWWVDDISITNVMVPSSCYSEPPLFADDFETGTTGAWSSVMP